MAHIKLFDDLNERFKAKVREYRIERTTFHSHGESSILSEGVAYIDAVFDLDVFDRLHKPALIGVERRIGGELWYTVFEVTSIQAYHLEMGSLRPDIPPLLKWDTLDRIEESWYRGGENWMSVAAVNTGYRIRETDKGVEVVKDILSPLVGSRAHILSAELYRFLVNKEGQTSVSIGDIVGYDIRVTLDIHALFRYHTGMFGYTGTGKSNLVSTLLRETMKTIKDLAVVVIDVSGEYPINILDLLHKYGKIYLDPTVNIERFVETTVFPETLESLMKSRGLKTDIVYNILDGIEKQYFETEPEFVTIHVLMESLNQISGKLQPYHRLPINRLKRLLSKYDLNEYVYKLSETDPEVWNEIHGTLNYVIEQYKKSRSAVKEMAEGLLAAISVKPVGERTESIFDICNDILFGEDRRLYLFYLPEIRTARLVLGKLVNTIFSFRKRRSGGRNVLFVIDEAHEFIPRDVRKEAFTTFSNEALELLFRQGRKYGIGGWIATQRVAHLNTNILQQLHSYFISILPRSYDRSVVADAFSISKSVVDGVVGFDKGEWLFVSHVATRYPNIPVRIKADNNEERIVEWLSNMS